MHYRKILVVAASAISVAVSSQASARFLAADPVQFSQEKPQIFNRYSYAYNDPINAWDPDGEETRSVTTKIWGGFGPAYGQSKTLTVEVNPDTGKAIGVATSSTRHFGAGIGAGMSIDGEFCGDCTLADMAGGGGHSSSPSAAESVTVEFDAVRAGAGASFNRPAEGDTSSLSSKKLSVSTGLVPVLEQM